MLEGKRWFDFVRREKVSEIKEYRFVDEVSNITDPFVQSVYKSSRALLSTTPETEVQMSG